MGEAARSDLRERKCTQNRAITALLEFYHCAGNDERNNERDIRSYLHTAAEDIHETVTWETPFFIPPIKSPFYKSVAVPLVDLT